MKSNEPKKIEEDVYESVYAPELGTFRKTKVTVANVEEIIPDMKEREKNNKSFLDKNGVLQFRFSSQTLERGISDVLDALSDHDLPAKMLIITRINALLKDKYNSLIEIK